MRDVAGLKFFYCSSSLTLTKSISSGLCDLLVASTYSIFPRIFIGQQGLVYSSGNTLGYPSERFSNCTPMAGKTYQYFATLSEALAAIQSTFIIV